MLLTCVLPLFLQGPQADGQVQRVVPYADLQTSVAERAHAVDELCHDIGGACQALQGAPGFPEYLQLRASLAELGQTFDASARADKAATLSQAQRQLLRQAWLTVEAKEHDEVFARMNALARAPDKLDDKYGGVRNQIRQRLELSRTVTDLDQGIRAAESRRQDLQRTVDDLALLVAGQTDPAAKAQNQAALERMRGALDSLGDRITALRDQRKLLLGEIARVTGDSDEVRGTSVLQAQNQSLTGPWARGSAILDRARLHVEQHYTPDIAALDELVPATPPVSADLEFAKARVRFLKQRIGSSKQQIESMQDQLDVQESGDLREFAALRRTIAIDALGDFLAAIPMKDILNAREAQGAISSTRAKEVLAHFESIKSALSIAVAADARADPERDLDKGADAANDLAQFLLTTAKDLSSAARLPLEHVDMLRDAAGLATETFKAMAHEKDPNSAFDMASFRRRADDFMGMASVVVPWIGNVRAGFNVIGDGLVVHSAGQAVEALERSCSTARTAIALHRARIAEYEAAIARYEAQVNSAPPPTSAR